MAPPNRVVLWKSRKIQLRLRPHAVTKPSGWSPGTKDIYAAIIDIADQPPKGAKNGIFA